MDSLPRDLFLQPLRTYRRSFSLDLLDGLKKNRYMFTDFAIVLGQREVSCHRLMIASACPYFETLLNSGMKEVANGKVHFEGFEPKLVEAIIDYFYSGKIRITWVNSPEMLRLTNFLQLDALQDEIESYICQNISTVDCIDWYKIGVNLDLEDIRTKSYDIFKNQFVAVSKTPSFAELTHTELDTLFKKSRPDAPYQLKALLEWVGHDINNRYVKINETLLNINLEHCHEQFVKYLCNAYADVIASLPSSWKTALQKDIQKNQSDGVRRLVLVNTNIEKLKEKPNCWSLQTSPSTFEKMWEEFTDLTMQETMSLYSDFYKDPDGDDHYPPQSKYLHVCSLTHGLAILDILHSVCYTFRQKCNSWKEYLLPEYFRGNFGFNLNIVGSTWTFSIFTEERFDSLNLISKRWSILPFEGKCENKHTKNISMVVCKDDIPTDLIFSFQQWDQDVHVKLFDTRKLEWCEKSKLDDTRIDYCSIACTEENVYLVGGEERVCVTYNIKCDQWSRLLPPQDSYRINTAVVYMRKIYLIGQLHLEEVFDLDDKRWTKRCDLRISTSFLPYLPNPSKHNCLLWVTC